ncbi:MFS transporter [Kaustia mangrovi]|uniref:MFS transporter n=1 Tax=Kaustia mangrovi TaxID=2593653 RepID=A0A7S8C2J8_9HYPH|nr:MFS transporter [Kaustia mangrovi]QPC42185.1 MFS transporter [Kaustia mangrovi]
MSTIGVGQSGFVALIPLIADRVGLGPGAIGFAVALGSLAFLVAAPIWGHRGERIGRARLMRRLGLVALASHLAVIAVMAVPPAPPLAALGALCAARFAYGVAGAGMMPTAQAWIAGTTAPEARPAALARLSAGLGTGRILGSLAAIASPLHPLAPFALMAASTASVALVPRSAAPAGPAGSAATAQPQPPLSLRDLWPVIAIGFLLTVCFGQIQVTLGPFLQVVLNTTPADATATTGWLLALVAIAMIATQMLVVPRLRLGPHGSVVAGAATVCAGTAAILASGTVWEIAAGLALAGAGTALATPGYTAWLTGRVERAAQGRATGWLASAHVGGQGIGALTGGLAFELWPALPFLDCAIIAGLVALIAAWMGRARRHTPRGQSG